MNSIKYLFFLFVVCLSEPFTVLALDGKGHKSDTFRIGINDSIYIENISISWNSLIIEDIVNYDGSSGGQAISLSILFKSTDAEEIWHLFLPVPYKEFIKGNSREVSFTFSSLTFCIIDADFENFNTTYLVIEVKTSGQTSYFIDNKPVNADEFTKFLKKLNEVEGTWYCAETKNGGETGYETKDKHGKVYQYRIITDNGISKLTLTKK